MPRAIETQVEAIARAWLMAGASALILCQDGHIVWRYPAEARPERAALEATIDAYPLAGCVLQVAGLSGTVAQARLDTDSRLLTEFLVREEELDRMTAELIDRQDQLLALYDLTRATRNHLSVEETLLALAVESVDLMDARAASVLLTLPGTEPIAVHQPDAYLPWEALLACDGQVRETQREMLVDSSATEGATPGSPRHLLLAPLIVRDAIAGSLIVVDRSSGAFTAADLKLARAMADQTSAQLERVLVYREGLAQARINTELELAVRIHSRLTPKRPPPVPGLDIWGSSRIALQMGGDYHDYYYTAGEPFTFVVADVSGKGVSAALLMSVTHTVFRNALRWMKGRSPEAIMQRLAVDLYESLSEVDMFVTFFCGQFDPRSREVQYANAGHSPIIYRPLEGTAQILQADGPPLGVLPESLCRNQTLRLGPGDVLIVGTDGFSEAHNDAAELFGYDRLCALANALHDRSAADIGTAFCAAVAEFSKGRPQDDDQTIVILRGLKR
jgi:sigma-B regulation protein RsbU (phosphoserine phosphatase)